ncbi:hypothetical protein [Peribacillus sp. NPDC097895]|uniref:hypothetical protein n=1 Tax=Peribacillus sp. NPDC097895 TaxID=3390619 RepID=UPI003D03E464
MFSTYGIAAEVSNGWFRELTYWLYSLLIIVIVINMMGVKMATKANAVPPCFS